MTSPHPSSNTPREGGRRRSRYHLDRTLARPYPLKHIAQGIAVLAALDQLGPLTNGQIRDLLFADAPGPHGQSRTPQAARKAANTTCQRLWENGFVTRQAVILTSRQTGGPYHHFVNLLTVAGARQVAAHYAECGAGSLRWTRASLDLKPLQVEHSLAINDFHILVARAARSAGLGFSHWQDDRQLAALKRAGQAQFANIPDGFFVLTDGARALGHFLELDRGTETVIATGWGRRDWRSKITGYGQYFSDWVRAKPLFAGVTAPIVLTVTTGDTRLRNLLEATRQAGGGGRYWYTTAAQLLDAGDPAAFWAPIWRVCSDPLPRSLHDRLCRAR